MKKERKTRTPSRKAPGATTAIFTVTTKRKIAGGHVVVVGAETTRSGIVPTFAQLALVIGIAPAT
jgi:hypothetical protein